MVAVDLLSGHQKQRRLPACYSLFYSVSNPPILALGPDGGVTRAIPSPHGIAGPIIASKTKSSALSDPFDWANSVIPCSSVPLSVKIFGRVPRLRML